ncbi:hypothetical protein HMPREF1868_00833 [Olsenella sp. DNF00959]|nr:hypothetical protein HMPREF1868_00833 [Olsenella sp. DNF00959]
MAPEPPDVIVWCGFLIPPPVSTKLGQVQSPIILHEAIIPCGRGPVAEPPHHVSPLPGRAPVAKRPRPQTLIRS